MSVNRRQFLAGTGSAALLLASGVVACKSRPTASPTLRSLDSIGIQLYTLRSLMQESVESTLQLVADTGYREVEFAGYFDQTPEQIRNKLDELNLVSPAVHVDYEAAVSNAEPLLDAAETVGHRYIVVAWMDPSLRSTLDDYKRHADAFNTLGELCKKRNMTFAYHNHEFEFEKMDGVVPFDLLLEQTEPELVSFEMDLFWIREGGQDALTYFKNHPGRFHLCHIKDMASDGEMVPVGKGVIDFAKIFAASSTAGLKHYFVEHDNPKNPVEDITTAFGHVSSLRF